MGTPHEPKTAVTASALVQHVLDAPERRALIAGFVAIYGTFTHGEDPDLDSLYDKIVSNWNGR